MHPYCLLRDAFLAGVIFALALAGCAPAGVPPPPGITASPPSLPTQPPPPTAARTQSPGSPRSPTLSPTVSPTATAVATSTPSSTPLPSHTATASVTPTYAILRGEVLQRSNCRYGPGAPYLYKYGLVVGSNLEVFGRTERGDWILVRAIGGNNPCWVKASLMDVKGDVMAVQPTYIPLPQSPYYGPLSGVSARREGSEVTISWSPRSLHAGDETASPPYLVEAWVCQGGKLEFIPIGSYEPAVKVTDEPGCAEPSHARVFLVEKHGYTRWVEVPWPGRE